MNEINKHNPCGLYSCYEPQYCPIFGTNAPKCRKSDTCRAYKASRRRYEANMASEALRFISDSMLIREDEIERLKKRVAKLEAASVKKGEPK